MYEAPDKPHKGTEELKQRVIFVDTPPHSHDVMYQAAAVSDMVIIPVQPLPLGREGCNQHGKGFTYNSRKNKSQPTMPLPCESNHTTDNPCKRDPNHA